MAARKRSKKQQPKPEPKLAAAPASHPSPDRKTIVVALGVLFLVLACLSTWFQFDYGDMMGYYDLYADGLAKGNHHLTMTPNQVNLVDMIPYEGRYYFNWGPFPVVFHFAARLIGLRLSDRVACLVAGWLTAALLLAILLRLRKRYWPELPLEIPLWAMFAFALATPAVLVTMRGNVYNEAIGVAALMIVVTFWAFLRYQEDSQSHWVLLAGTATGLAAVTRVTSVLYAIPFFLAFGAQRWFRDRSVPGTLSHMAAFSVPVFLCCGLLMANNQARFGSPFDFGRTYKPESIANPEIKAFNLVCAPESLGHYLISGPTITRDFPWVVPDGLEPVECVTRAEAMSSMFLLSPFLALVFFAWPIRESSRPIELRLAGGLALGSALFIFGVMTTFASASRRYMQDFVPLLMVVAFVGLMLKFGPEWKRWRVTAWVVLLLSIPLNIQAPFYQSFFTPTPDLNVIRFFVKAAPTLRSLLPGPELDEQAAIAANDLGTMFMRERRFGAALTEFEKAAEWLPGDPRIEKNVALARQMAPR